MKRNITNSLWLALATVSYVIALIFLTSGITTNDYTSIIWYVFAFTTISLIALIIWVIKAIFYFYKEIEELKKKSK